jgi:hypothetical protein
MNGLIDRPESKVHENAYENPDASQDEEIGEQANTVHAAVHNKKAAKHKDKGPISPFVDVHSTLHLFPVLRFYPIGLRIQCPL